MDKNGPDKPNIQQINIRNSKGINLGNQNEIHQIFSSRESIGDEEILLIKSLFQKLESRLISLETTLDVESLKNYLSTILRGLKDLDKNVLQALHDDKVNTEFMQESLQAISTFTSELKSKQLSNESELSTTVSRLEGVLESELGLTGKFELTLPIIPFFLNYKTELSLSARARLEEVFDKLKSLSE